MRGQLLLYILCKLPCGITPAGAGKTRRSRSCQICNADHPRRCGENGTFAPEYKHTLGSPPQVRGKQSQSLCSSLRFRITPAGAGKTSPMFKQATADRDHPRRCGENSTILRSSLLTAGSPPQVRGKRFDDLFKIIGYRITPAGAGKTDHSRGDHHHGGDHPRRCGENIQLCCMVDTTLGSPPQVRGKLCAS